MKAATFFVVVLCIVVSFSSFALEPWTVSFTTPTVTVYTDADTTLPVSVTNPHATPRDISVLVTFFSHPGDPDPLTVRIRASAQGGTSTLFVPIPANTAKAAATASNRTARASIRNGGGRLAAAKAPLAFTTTQCADPTVAITFDATSYWAGAPVGLTASATCGTPPYTFAWTFGDGSPVSSGPVVSHVYSTPALYGVTVSVTDSSSPAKTASTRQDVAIQGDPLGASIAVYYENNPGWQCTNGQSVGVFYATATGGDYYYSYAIDYGDGTTERHDPPLTGQFAHYYSSPTGEPKTYNAVLTVTDGAGNSATARVTASFDCR